MIGKDNKGFTLIELVFVIVLLSIILSIVVITYPGLLRNMKVRSDKAAANQVARAVRSWYTDYSTDPSLKNSMTVLGSNTIALDTITGIERYVDPGSRPYSMLDENGNIEDNQKFFVGMIGTGLNEKIVISIGTVGVSLDENVTENYDATGNAVAYIEPPKSKGE